MIKASQKCKNSPHFHVKSHAFFYHPTFPYQTSNLTLLRPQGKTMQDRTGGPLPAPPSERSRYYEWTPSHTSGPPILTGFVHKIPPGSRRACSVVVKSSPDQQELFKLCFHQEFFLWLPESVLWRFRGSRTSMNLDYLLDLICFRRPAKSKFARSPFVLWHLWKCVSEKSPAYCLES